MGAFLVPPGFASDKLLMSELNDNNVSFPLYSCMRVSRSSSTSSFNSMEEHHTQDDSDTGMVRTNSHPPNVVHKRCNVHNFFFKKNRKELALKYSFQTFVSIWL